MSAVLKDKDIEIDGKVIGASSIIRLNLQTAFWILSIIAGLVFSILTHSYLSLKKDFRDFTDTTDEKVEKIYRDVQDIRIGQESIRGDIKLILDRQTRDNPISSSPDQQVDPSNPPPISDINFSYGPLENDVTFNPNNY